MTTTKDVIPTTTGETEGIETAAEETGTVVGIGPGREKGTAAETGTEIEARTGIGIANGTEAEIGVQEGIAEAGDEIGRQEETETVEIEVLRGNEFLKINH